MLYGILEILELFQFQIYLFGVLFCHVRLLHSSADLELLIFLHPPPKCQYFKHVPPCLIYAQLFMIYFWRFLALNTQLLVPLLHFLTFNFATFSSFIFRKVLSDNLFLLISLNVAFMYFNYNCVKMCPDLQMRKSSQLYFLELCSVGD